jgi:putative iron-dependent peroxidase
MSNPSQLAMPQTAILNGTHSRAFYFLEYKIKDSISTSQLVDVLKTLPTPTKPNYQLLAFSPEWTETLLPATASLHLAPMKTLTGPDHRMPGVQNDILFWIHGEDVSDVYDQALAIQNALSELADIQIDQSAFTYHDSRDLIGFEDGTANPKDDDRKAVALITDGELAGGSIVFTQQWQHKLNEFLALPVDQQEKVVGRTKVENIELEGDAMPDDSHVSRTDVKINGEAMKIYRRSAPYGNTQDKGLMFLCFACKQERIQVQLERMTGCTEDGISDHLMKYSTPVSGSYWYAPNQKQLASLV